MSAIATALCVTLLSAIFANGEKGSRSSDFVVAAANMSTIGAYFFEFFEIADESYLAVPQFNQASNHSVPSQLFMWDSTSNSFEQMQNITECKCCLGLTSFEINGSMYLAGASTISNSVILKWSPSSQSFELFQTLDNFENQFHSVKFQYALINDVPFLATISSDLVYAGSLRIFTWNFTTQQFETFQIITVNNPLGLAFNIPFGTPLIAVQEWDTNQVVTFSFNKQTRLFEALQIFPNSKSWDMEFYSIDEEWFFGVASFYNGTTLYRLESNSLKLSPAQYLPSQLENNALTVFTHNNDVFLVIANWQPNYCPMFIWDASLGQFVTYQNISTPGYVQSFTSFEVSGQSYLAGSYGEPLLYSTLFLWSD